MKIRFDSRIREKMGNRFYRHAALMAAKFFLQNKKDVIYRMEEYGYRVSNFYTFYGKTFYCNDFFDDNDDVTIVEVATEDVINMPSFHKVVI